MLSSRHNEKKEQDANKDFNSFYKEETMSILDFAILSLNGMLLTSSRVSHNFQTTTMYSFLQQIFYHWTALNFSQLNSNAYDVRAFSEK